MVEIFAINIKDGIKEEFFQHFCRNISKEKQKKIKRFIRLRDRERSLAAEILIRYNICKKLQLKNKDLLFSANEYGKPYLINRPDFHYNIAHSGSWIICAHDENEVGIDVERIREVNLDIAKRFFTREEFLEINNRPVEEAREYFFDIWTLKESYIKALGRGLSVSLDSFSFKLSGEKIFFQTEHKGEKYQFKKYDIAPSYKLAVCIKEGTFPEKINLLDFKTIYDSGTIT